MFPAPPLQRGADLNEIQAREEASLYASRKSVFGPPTPESIKVAQQFQSQHAPSRINIDAFFALLNQEQNQQGTDDVEEITEELSVASSSMPVIDDVVVEEEAVEQPKQKKSRGRGGKAPAKTDSSTEVVKKTSTDF